MAPRTQLPSAFDELGATVDSNLATAQSDYSTNLEKFFNTNPNSITPTQALMQGLMNILPMIIGGAVAKKKGALIGTKAGIDAGNSYRTNIEASNKQEQGKALVGLDRAKEQLNTAQKQKFDLTKTEFTEGNKDRRNEENNISRNNRAGQISSAMIRAAREGKSEGSSMTDTQIDKIVENRDQYNEIKGTVNQVKKLIPEALSESYLDESGNFSLEKSKQILGRVADENFWGANTPAGEAKAALQTNVNNIAHDKFGAAQSDNELKGLYTELGKFGMVPATIPIQLRILERYAEIQKERAINRADTVQSLRQGESAGPIKQRVQRMFGEETPDDSAIATPENDLVQQKFPGAAIMQPIEQKLPDGTVKKFIGAFDAEGNFIGMEPVI